MVISKKGSDLVNSFFCFIFVLLILEEMKNYVRNYFIRLKNHSGVDTAFGLTMITPFLAYFILSFPISHSIALGLWLTMPIWIIILITNLFD